MSNNQIDECQMTKFAINTAEAIQTRCESSESHNNNIGTCIVNIGDGGDIRVKAIPEIQFICPKGKNLGPNNKIRTTPFVLYCEKNNGQYTDVDNRIAESISKTGFISKIDIRTSKDDKSSILGTQIMLENCNLLYSLNSYNSSFYFFSFSNIKIGTVASKPNGESEGTYKFIFEPEISQNTFKCQNHNKIIERQLVHGEYAMVEGRIKIGSSEQKSCIFGIQQTTIATDVRVSTKGIERAGFSLFIPYRFFQIILPLLESFRKGQKVDGMLIEEIYANNESESSETKNKWELKNIVVNNITITFPIVYVDLSAKEISTEIREESSGVRTFKIQETSGESGI